LLTIAAAEDCNMYFGDVPSAFLNTPRQKGAPKIYVRLKSGGVVNSWLKIRPNDAKHKTTNGDLIIRLNQYLYGMKDAPAAFHAHLKECLSKAGFTTIISDACIVTKYTANGYLIAGIFVDDIFIIEKNASELVEEFQKALTRAFGNGQDIVLQPCNNSKDTSSFVGTWIERDRPKRTIYLSQPQVIQKIKDKYDDVNWTRPVKSPAADDALSYDPNATEYENGSLVNVTKYKGKVMSAMYVAIRTRPEYLMILGYLSSITQPTQRADDMINRVLVHLYQTRGHKLKLSPKGLQLSAYADASYAIHLDGYSHSGMVFCLGGSPFFCKSIKQKRVTLSSTEAEFEALTECVKYVQWMRELLSELRFQCKGPTKIYQDNKSTITLATMPGSFKRSKHTLVRYAYVKEMVNNNHVKLEWVKTTEQKADVLTKILTGTPYEHARKGLGMAFGSV
jgi:Reverse transcriptase (RNA-dependent DNA polymerase)